MHGDLTAEEAAELAWQEKAAWGERAHGFIETIEPGRARVVVYVHERGKHYVRGRAVYMFEDKTILGSEYFWPPGRYPGRILS